MSSKPIEPSDSGTPSRPTPLGAARVELEVCFSKPCSEAIAESLGASTVVVEYGAGGSTLVAADAPDRTVITVDSDQAYLNEVMVRAEEGDVAGRIVPLWCDIGPTKKWGYPRDFSHWRRFPRYAVTPWDYVREYALRPDLVVIDGRFRVACFLATCTSIQQLTKIFVDDYTSRPNYHRVEQLLKPARIVDRMAIFEAPPGLITADFLLRNLDVFYRPYH